MSDGSPREGVTGVNLVCREPPASEVLEPAAAADDIQLAIAVHIANGQSLVLVDAFKLRCLSSLRRFTIGWIGVDLGEGPQAGASWIRWNAGHHERVGALVPKDQFLFAISQKVSKRQIVVL